MSSAAVRWPSSHRAAGVTRQSSGPAGRCVLVNGAAGGVGPFAVQLAVAMGAKVTGVCSTSNVELVLSLGAHEVIDYTCGEIGERQFDLIIDNIGNHSLAQRRKMMAPTGKCVVIGAPKKGKLLGPITAMVRAVIGSRPASRSSCRSWPRPTLRIWRCWPASSPMAVWCRW